jgi:hypothetical protein
MSDTFLCPHCSQPANVEKEIIDQKTGTINSERQTLMTQPEEAAPNNAMPDLTPATPTNRAINSKPSGLSVFGLVFAILGFLSGWMCFGMIFSIIGAICGHIAFSQIQRSSEKITGKRIAIASFTIAYAGLLLSLLIAYFCETHKVYILLRNIILSRDISLN